MNIHGVFDLIMGERIYQENMLEHADKKQQRETAVAAWLIYMEKHIQLAKDEIYCMNEKAALEHIRKITALGFACMEHNETPARVERAKCLSGCHPSACAEDCPNHQ